MKIGIDARLMGFQHGGIGRYVFELAANLPVADQKNEYVIFFNQDGQSLVDDLGRKQSGRRPAVTFVPANIRHYSLREQSGFHRLLQKYPVDLMHFPNFNVPLKYERPFVVTIHDMVHHKISGHKKSRLPRFWAYKKIITAAARNAAAIITVSEASKKDIASYLQAAAEKIFVTYEGASLATDVSTQRVAEIKRRYLLNQPYFLFVGVLERKKNVVNLTRAFDLFLEQSRVNMDFAIVGRGDPHYPDIKHHALDIRHNDHLVFTGAVDDYELAALYKGAYAFVSASLHEGFGLPGVEALAFGLPLLVSNTAVFNEIYDNAAIYFNPLDPADIAEKMGILVRDSQFYEQVQEKSFARAQQFSWPKMAEETLEIYQNILSS